MMHFPGGVLSFATLLPQHSYSTSSRPGLWASCGIYSIASEIISLTQFAYHVGKLWTKLKDAAFKTVFIWGCCRILWYVTCNSVKLTQALLGNPNPRLNKKSKPARSSETNITALLKTFHRLHTGQQGSPESCYHIWAGNHSQFGSQEHGSKPGEINQKWRPSWAAAGLSKVIKKQNQGPFQS